MIEERDMPMTRRENLLAALGGGGPERIPIVGHIDPYARPSMEGMPPEILREAGEHGWWSGHAALAYARLLDLDIAAWTPPPLRVTQRRCTAEESVEGKDTIRVAHTPAGDMREVVRQTEDGCASYIMEHLVKGPEDLPRLAEYSADQKVELSLKADAEVEARAKDIGEDGILISALEGTPLGMLIRVYAGPEVTAYLHADAPDGLADLFGVMEANHRRKFELAAQTPIDAFLGMDDTSTTTQSPAMFEQYCMRYTDRMAELVNAKGKKYWHHSCGLIKDLLPLYRQTKMDAVHAFTEPPTGNVCVDEGRKVLGDGIGIVTGLWLTNHPLDRRKAGGLIESKFKRLDRHCCLNLSGRQHLTFDDMRWVREECRKYQ